MATKGTYNHQQIERYLQKEMSSAEMHAFEKDLMNDPLLADAFEGYRDSNKILTTQHLAEIANRVTDGKKDNAVRYKISANWLRIAALLIIIGGAGLIAFNILNEPADSEAIAAIDNNPPVLAVDSISATDLTTRQQQSFAQKPPANSSSASSPVVQQPPAEATQAETPPAAPPLALRKTALPADSLLMVNADVHVQSDGLSKEQKASTERATKTDRLSEAGVAGKTTYAQPKDGWVKLQAYIDHEVNIAKEKNNALTGMKVELAFSVDKSGNVTNIKMISASNTEVGKIAIDILKRSPRSISLADNPSATIVLNF